MKLIGLNLLNNSFKIKKMELALKHGESQDQVIKTHTRRDVKFNMKSSSESRAEHLN